LNTIHTILIIKEHILPQYLKWYDPNEKYEYHNDILG